MGDPELPGMPTVTNAGIDIRYETQGSGPTVVFCNDAGLGAWEWSYLLGSLSGTVETLVWDYRGTGASDTPAGPYSVADLVGDLEAVLTDHGARSVHLVGAGLGGYVAAEYARESGRSETLTLFGTPHSPADIDREALDRLWASGDDSAAIRESLRVAFAPETVTEHPEEMDRIVGWRRDDDAGATGWDGQRAAFLDHELTALYEMTTPTTVYHGVEDRIVDSGAGQRLAEELPRGEYRAVEGGHCCFVESAGAVADALVGTLTDQDAFEHRDR